MEGWFKPRSKVQTASHRSVAQAAFVNGEDVGDLSKNGATVVGWYQSRNQCDPNSNQRIETTFRESIRSIGKFESCPRYRVRRLYLAAMTDDRLLSWTNYSTWFPSGSPNSRQESQKRRNGILRPSERHGLKMTSQTLGSQTIASTVASSICYPRQHFGIRLNRIDDEGES